jgi:hypothetical protein
MNYLHSGREYIAVLEPIASGRLHLLSKGPCGNCQNNPPEAAAYSIAKNLFKSRYIRN